MPLWLSQGNPGETFFQLYWGIIDNTVEYLKCTMWWLDTGIFCETTPPINLINSSSTPPIHLSSLWRKHLCFTHSKFRLWYRVVKHNTPLHIRVSDLIHLIIESLLPFTNLSLFPLPPAPGNHFSTPLKEHLKVLVWRSGSREGVCASLLSLRLQ